MKTRVVPQWTMAAFVVTCLTAPSAIAQSEKVTIRSAPGPNQSIRERMVQEMDLELLLGAAPGLPADAMMPMRLTMKTVVRSRQDTGAARADGTYDAELTYEEVQSDLLMNGQPMPNAAADASLLGKKALMTYDREGTIVNLKNPVETGAAGDFLRTVLESFQNNLPTNPIGVGETVTVPMSVTLPLPLPGGSALKIDGQTHLRLASIDADAAGRTARFEHTAAGALVQDLELPTPAGSVKVSLDFTLSGGGTMLKDLDKGILRSSDSDTAIDGTITIAAAGGPAPAIPPMTLKGKLKVLVTSEN